MYLPRLLLRISACANLEVVNRLIKQLMFTFWEDISEICKQQFLLLTSLRSVLGPAMTTGPRTDDVWLAQLQWFVYL